MGITISSKRFSCNMGNFGFIRFREMVAKQVGEDFHLHYHLLFNGQQPSETNERKQFFKDYDAKTDDFIEKKEVSEEIVDFLYQSDADGKINRRQARMIYELIKECEDDIVYGYSAKPNCAKMSDMKNIFSDKTNVVWY